MVFDNIIYKKYKVFSLILIDSLIKIHLVIEKTTFVPASVFLAILAFLFQKIDDFINKLNIFKQKEAI